MKVAIFQLALFGVNCYVVYDEKEKKAAVIDPGIISDEEVEAIDNFLKKNELEVTHILNTHLHIDHVIGNWRMIEKYGVDAYAHEEDSFLGDRLASQAKEFQLPFDVKDSGVTKYLQDGDEIKIGEGCLKVIHVPGHSPGGVVLYDKEDGFLIAGDSLFEGSIGRTDLPGGDMSTLLKAIKEKLFILPDTTVVFPGHGPSTTIGDEKKFNPFLR